MSCSAQKEWGDSARPTAFVLHRRRIGLSHQQSWLMGHHSSSQTSYCMCRILCVLTCCCRHGASILRCSRQPAAGTLSPVGSCVSGCWQPADASGGPICRPLRGGLQGDQDFHHTGGPKVGDRLRGPPEGSHRSGPIVSCRGHPSRPTSQVAGHYPTVHSVPS
jgi:hypothetical protein